MKDWNLFLRQTEMQGKSPMHQLNGVLYPMCLLDIIMLPEEKSWLRLVQYHAENGVHNYVIDNGSGDSLMVWLIQEGVFIKGFDHENPLNQFAADTWNEAFFDHVYAGIPAHFLELMTQEQRDETTFCMWYEAKKEKWTQHRWKNQDGGEKFLLGYLMETPQEWKAWAEDYYECSIDETAVQKIYDTQMVDEESITTLNPSRDVHAVFQEIQSLGDIDREWDVDLPE